MLNIVSTYKNLGKDYGATSVGRKEMVGFTEITGL